VIFILLPSRIDHWANHVIKMRSWIYNTYTDQTSLRFSLVGAFEKVCSTKRFPNFFSWALSHLFQFDVFHCECLTSHLVYGILVKFACDRATHPVFVSYQCQICLRYHFPLSLYAKRFTLMTFKMKRHLTAILIA
jgi:hypothetical protein